MKILIPIIVATQICLLSIPALARGGGGGGGGHGGGGHGAVGCASGGGGGGHSGYGGGGWGSHGGGRNYGGGGYYYDPPDPRLWGNNGGSNNGWGNHGWGTTPQFNAAFNNGYAMPSVMHFPPQLNSSLPTHLNAGNMDLVVKTYNWPKHEESSTSEAACSVSGVVTGANHQKQLKAHQETLIEVAERR